MMAMHRSCELGLQSSRTNVQRRHVQWDAVDERENAVDRAEGNVLPNAAQYYIFWDSVQLPVTNAIFMKKHA